MVQGMGLGTRFITLLTGHIANRGGCEEILHSLTTADGEPNMVRTAEFILGLEWRVSRSLIERLIEEEFETDHGVYRDARTKKRLRCFSWDVIGLERRFQIPVISFGRWFSGLPGDGLSVPKEIEDQILGKRINHTPMVVTWNSQPHIVVSVWGGDSDQWELQSIPSLPPIGLKLSPAQRFDLNH